MEWEKYQGITDPLNEHGKCEIVNKYRLFGNRLISEMGSFDPTKPDGTPRKLMNPTLLRETGWKPKIDLETGLQDVYGHFMKALQAETLRS